MSAKTGFPGFLRQDGRKGIRNTVLVVYLVECAHHVAREIVHRMVRSDESESARMNLHPAGHQVHPIGQAVAVAPNPDQIAALDEHGETAAQRRALLVRPAEPLQQLPHGRGVIHRSSNLIEQVVRVEHRRGRRYAISATCRSPTLVSVGPVRIRSSSASKKV